MAMRIALGFQLDAEKLIMKFERKQSVRFADFAEVWKEMEFALIFSGREHVADLSEFTAECFYIAKKFLVFKKNVFTQIGGLYLLYGLYFKQPVKDFVKIRLTLDEFKLYKELLLDCKANNHLDAAFIAAKLIAYDCLEFVAFQVPAKIETNRWKRMVELKNDTFKDDMVSVCYDKFSNLLSASGKNIEELTKRYEEAKKKIDDNSDTLRLSNKRLAADLEGIIKAPDELNIAVDETCGPSTSKGHSFD